MSSFHSVRTSATGIAKKAIGILRRAASAAALLSLLLTGLAPGAAGAASITGHRAHASMMSGQLGVASSRAMSSYGGLPMSFEANRGQVDPRVNFLVHGAGYTLFLTQAEAVLALHPPTPSHSFNPLGARVEREQGSEGVLGLRFVGANRHPQIVGLRKLPGIVNYLIGNNPTHWHTRIPTFAMVEERNVYPGVNVEFYGKAGHLEYDLVLRPGVDPHVVHLHIDGAQGVRLDRRGNLRVRVGASSCSCPELVQATPTIYQTTPAGRTVVAGGYVLRGSRDIGFRLGKYNAHQPLVIDPELMYSTYLGGTGGDGASGIALDRADNAYVVGTTYSTDFPICPNSDGLPPCTHDNYSPIQPIEGGNHDIFVSKIDVSGSFLWYSTYLGGSQDEDGSAIAVDSNGDAYITGDTDSANFPSLHHLQGWVAGYDAIAVELVPDGTAMVWGTFLGGNGDDGGLGITLGADPIVVGYTDSTDFPTCPANISPARDACASDAAATQMYLGGGSDAFVANIHFDPSAGTLTLNYSTYFGGTGNDEAETVTMAQDLAFGDSVNIAGNTSSTDLPYADNANAGGTDAFVALIHIVSSCDQYGFCQGWDGRSSYLGGGQNDVATGIAEGPLGPGSGWVVGYTNSADFPSLNHLQGLAGGYDAFAVQWDFSRTSWGMVYGTFLGGSGDDWGYGVASDAQGNAYVAGFTDSSDFPTSYPLQYGIAGGDDAFLTEINSSGAMVYSTYFGGSENDYGNAVAVDRYGTGFIAGQTYSSDFPSTGGLQRPYNSNGDAFVAAIPQSTSHFSVVPSATSVAAGKSFTVTVTAQDDADQTTPFYYGTLRLYSYYGSSSSGTLLTSYTFTAADAGAHSFSVSLNTAGTWTLKAYDAINGMTGTSPKITVVAPPSISSISPTSVVMGGSTFTLTVNGSNFDGSSTVFWNGSARSTTYVSSTQLTATISPSDIQGEEAAEITVNSYGVISNVAVFYVTQQSTTVTASNSSTSSSSTGTASASVGGSGPNTAGSVTSSATGAGTLTVAQYSSNPGGTTNFDSPGGFFDVHLSSGNSFSSASIVDCNLNGGNTVFWYNGSTWTMASNQSYNPSTTCVTVTVTSGTVPSLSQLNGTIFSEGAAIPIAMGWNLIALPLQNSAIHTAQDLVSTLNSASAVGAGAVVAVATFDHGAFHLFVPGYSAAQILAPTQGIFVLSHKAGQWTPTGKSYSSGQTVTLVRGWNLVAAPFPSAGLTTQQIADEIKPACGSSNCVQEIAAFSGGYRVWTAGGTSFAIPNTSGMWIEMAQGATWTPQ